MDTADVTNAIIALATGQDQLQLVALFIRWNSASS